MQSQRLIGEQLLKILAINWRDRGDPLGGGAEVHLHEILRRLVQWGHIVTWVSSAYDGAANEEIASDGIRHIRGGNWRWANFSLPQLMKKELQKNSYDIVVEDINKIPFYSPLHTGLPVLAIVPHLFGSTVFRETNALFGSYVWASEWPIPIVYRKCRFMAISQSTAGDLARRGIDRTNIDVVECGMDHHRYVLENPPARSEHPRIIHLGRLRKYKSVDVVIEAMKYICKEHPSAELHIIGDGPDEARLRRLANTLGVAQQIHFRGYLPREEIVQELYKSHLFLNPSPKEGWGLTVIEANECGVPVVASRRPGLVDSVQEGKTGLLAEYGDAEEFASKALQLLDDEVLWKRYSNAAVEWAHSFSWDDCARKTEAILQKAIR